MQDIICPHCGKAFKIDESGYADILKQIRDGEFEKQLHERLELAEQDKHNAVELAQAKLAGELQKEAAAKDAQIQEASVRFVGATAIVLNRIRLVAVVGGNEVVNPFVVTEVYVKQGDAWTLASLSCTRLLR